ncbi:MAG: hypothetical protein HN368_22295 [Spirochaetales bacterium]|nr:hypothetical protein [Spirochaetales bacterium]
MDRRLLCILALLFFGFSATQIYAVGIVEPLEREEYSSSQEALVEVVPQGTAVLETGPNPGRGILMLSSNVLEFHEGRYIDGGTVLRVQYTQEQVFIPEDWVSTRCTGELLHFILDDGTLHYAYISEDAWAVFFSVPISYESPCSFIVIFLQRLRYFKSVSEESAPVPFPAVLEIS